MQKYVKVFSTFISLFQGFFILAQKALKIGLVDEILNLQDFERLKSQLINDLLYGAPQAQSNVKSFF